MLGGSAKTKKLDIEAASSTTVNAQNGDPTKQIGGMNHVKGDSALAVHQQNKSVTPGGGDAKEDEYLKDANIDNVEKRGRTKKN